jgi:hypothetical protein
MKDPSGEMLLLLVPIKTKEQRAGTLRPNMQQKILNISIKLMLLRQMVKPVQIHKLNSQLLFL